MYPTLPGQIIRENLQGHGTEAVGTRKIGSSRARRWCEEEDVVVWVCRSLFELPCVSKIKVHQFLVVAEVTFLETPVDIIDPMGSV